jgi:ABC-2 type transport system permease protein
VTHGRTADLARIGVSLRWRLIDNQTTRSGRKRRRWPAVLFSVLYAVGNIAGLAVARVIDDTGAEQTLVVLASSLALGWIFGPILSGGVDETVDPTRLALLPLRTSERFTVQVAAAMSGTGPAAALIGLSVGIPVGFAGFDAALPAVLLAGPVSVLAVLGMGRVVAAVLAIAQRSRAGRDLAVLVASLVAGALFVLAQLGSEFADARGERIVGWLAWAPWSWGARAASAARTGHVVTSWMWLAAAVGLCVGVMFTWAWLSQSLLLRGERIVRSGRRGRGAALFGARSLLGATLARQLIYLFRSPNTRVSFVFGIAFGVAFSLVQIIQRGGADHPLAPFGALLAMVANLGATSNLLGFDAGSMWIEVAAGGPGREHLVARSVMALPNLLIPTWISTLVVGAWTEQWRSAALVALIAIPIALVALAIGMITSLKVAWPLPDGDNPFANRQATSGRQARLAVIGLSGVFGSGIVSAPIIVAAYVWRESSWGFLVPAIGTAAALAFGAAVLAWASRRLDGSEPEYLELLSPLAMN